MESASRGSGCIRAAVDANDADGSFAAAAPLGVGSVAAASSCIICAVKCDDCGGARSPCSTSHRCRLASSSASSVAIFSSDRLVASRATPSDDTIANGARCSALPPRPMHGRARRDGRRRAAVACLRLCAGGSSASRVRCGVNVACSASASSIASASSTKIAPAPARLWLLLPPEEASSTSTSIDDTKAYTNGPTATALSALEGGGSSPV